MVSPSAVGDRGHFGREQPARRLVVNPLPMALGRIRFATDSPKSISSTELYVEQFIQQAPSTTSTWRAAGLLAFAGHSGSASASFRMIR